MSACYKFKFHSAPLIFQTSMHAHVSVCDSKFARFMQTAVTRVQTIPLCQEDQAYLYSAANSRDLLTQFTNSPLRAKLTGQYSPNSPSLDLNSLGVMHRLATDAA